jgi:hypothetical protein
MMRKCSTFAKLLGVFVVFSLLTGCGLSITVKEPTPSTVNYTRQNLAPVTLNVVDARTGADTQFVRGKLGFGGEMKDISGLLKLANIENPISFLSTQLEKELNNRGIPAKCVVGQTGGQGLTLTVIRYQILNYRASGFSPWEACHLFYGIIEGNGVKTPIKAYFYNGKTPVWSMTEINEPCFDVPTSIIIKEVASKINRAIFSLQAPDGKVDALTAEIDAEVSKQKPGGPFWKVLELGYTNNPNAMEPLKKYSQQGGDEFFKSCALTAIGTLNPEGQFEFLKQRYDAGGYNDRYMAAKAIGDIGSDQALHFIEGLKGGEAYNGEGGLKSCVDLYTP